MNASARARSRDSQPPAGARLVGRRGPSMTSPWLARPLPPGTGLVRRPTRLESAGHSWRVPVTRSQPAYNRRVDAEFQTWCDRGRRSGRQGRYAEAESAWRQALSLRPGDVKARLELALTLRRQRRPADAETVLREAVAYDPTSATPHAELGAVLFEQGRYAEAATAFS